MHLMYTDETNLNPGASADFFIYGGLVISTESAKLLSDEIEEIRTEFGYRPTDALKFSVHDKERSDHISRDQHREAKRRVIECSVRHRCNLLISLIYHSLATSPEEARRREINRICYHFDCMLNQAGSHGIVLVDNFSDPNLVSHLKEKFTTGLTGMPYSASLPLKRVLGYHVSSLGTSHFPSVVDIVLGSLRYAINNRTDQSRKEVSSALLQQLSPLFLRNTSSEVEETSLFFSPKQVRVPVYLEKYKDLHQFLSCNGIVAAQRPTDQRNY